MLLAMRARFEPDARNPALLRQIGVQRDADELALGRLGAGERDDLVAGLDHVTRQEVCLLRGVGPDIELEEDLTPSLRKTLGQVHPVYGRHVILRIKQDVCDGQGLTGRNLLEDPAPAPNHPIALMLSYSLAATPLPCT
jgi:hypothetical protein